MESGCFGLDREKTRRDWRRLIGRERVVAALILAGGTLWLSGCSGRPEAAEGAPGQSSDGVSQASGSRAPSSPVPGQAGSGRGEVPAVSSAPAASAARAVPPASSAGHTLTGTVRDTLTGAPVPGARVTVQATLMAERDAQVPTTPTLADASGRYRLEGVVPFESETSDVLMKASAPGYLGESLPFVRLTTETREVVRDVALKPAAVLAGRVMLQDGRPAAGAKLLFHRKPENTHMEIPEEVLRRLPRYEATADASGAYQIDIEPRLAGSLRVELEGWVAQVSPPLTTTRGRMADVDFTLTSGAVVSGTVIGPDDAPVAEARVEIRVDPSPGSGIDGPPAISSLSGPDGAFALEGVSGGSGKLLARKEPFVESARTELEIADGSTTEGLVLRLRRSLSISGRVLDEQERPVAGARVGGGLRGRPEEFHAEAVSTTGGVFLLPGVPEGEYGLYATKERYQHGDITWARAGDTGVVVRVKGIPAEITMTGRVIDLQTREPIADFEVETKAPETRIEKDPAQAGLFRWSGLRAEGSWKLVLKAPGYMDSTQQVLPEKENFGRTFALGKGGAITGRVVELPGGRPLAGIQVFYPLDDTAVSSATTGSDGRFRLEAVVPGRKSVQVKTEEPLVQLREAVCQVKHGETCDLGDVEIGAGGTIRGRVLRRPENEPAPGVKVQLYAGRRLVERQTGDDGSFEFSGLSAGTQKLRLPDFEQIDAVPVGPNAVVEHDLFIGGATLEARLENGGKAMPGMLLLMKGNPRSLEDSDVREPMTLYREKTDEEGRLTLSNLAPGTWQAIVGRGDDSVHQETLELGPGVTQHTFRFPSAALKGRVVDTDGNPVAGARVCVRRPGGPEGLMQLRQHQSVLTTGADGTFEKSGYAAGEYTLTAQKEELGVSATTPVPVPAEGDAAPVTLRLDEPGGALESVALSMSTGEPMRHAWASLKGVRGEYVAGNNERDEFGAVTIRDIPPGRYTLKVSAEGHTAAERAVEIRAGETLKVQDVLEPDGGA